MTSSSAKQHLSNGSSVFKTHPLNEDYRTTAKGVRMPGSTQGVPTGMERTIEHRRTRILSVDGTERPEVGVLDEEPTPWTNSLCHARQRQFRLGQVRKQIPAANQIVLLRLQVLGKDVVFAYFDIGRELRSSQHTRGQVGGHYLA